MLRTIPESGVQFRISSKEGVRVAFADPRAITEI